MFVCLFFRWLTAELLIPLILSAGSSIAMRGRQSQGIHASTAKFESRKIGQERDLAQGPTLPSYIPTTVGPKSMFDSKAAFAWTVLGSQPAPQREQRHGWEGIGGI